MKVLKNSGGRYSGEVKFSGPGELTIGTEVKLEEAERMVKDFPERFEIIDLEDEKSKAPESEKKAEPEAEKQATPKQTKEMKPKKTK